MENMNDKIKSIAYKLVDAVVAKDEKKIAKIESALETMLQAQYDPYGSVSKLFNYISAFHKQIRQNDTLITQAAWKALNSAVVSLMGDSIDQWRWYSSFENYFAHASSMLAFEAEKEEAEKAEAERAKTIEGAFASLGL